MAHFYKKYELPFRILGAILIQLLKYPFQYIFSFKDPPLPNLASRAHMFRGSN